MQQFGRSRVTNRLMPVANRSSEERWVQHCQDLHVKKLREMKPVVRTDWEADLKQPTYAHLTHNWKRLQQDDQRFEAIEHENMRLLARMYKLSERGEGGRSVLFAPGVKLNANMVPMLDDRLAPSPMPGTATLPRRRTPVRRRRELERITHENLALARRLAHQPPVYERAQFEQHAARSRSYLRLISDFPPYKQPSLRDETARAPPQLSGPAKQLWLAYTPAKGDASPTAHSDHGGGAGAGAAGARAKAPLPPIPVHGKAGAARRSAAAHGEHASRGAVGAAGAASSEPAPPHGSGAAAAAADTAADSARVVRAQLELERVAGEPYPLVRMQLMPGAV